MAQIPLERTIGDTYRFALGNVLSIFGIVWFPILLLAAAAAAGVWWLWSDIAGMDWSAHADAARSQEAAMRLVFKAFAVAGPFYILFYVLIAMMNVGVQRKALGLFEGPVFFYFSLESTVWRFLGAMILAVILIYIGAALTVGAVAAVFWAGEHFGLPALYGLVEFAAVVAGICWFFYMAVRLMFFLPTVVVAEGGLGLARSWELGAGNFWRIAALFIVCIFAPMMAISMVSNIIVLPFMMSDDSAAACGGCPPGRDAAADLGSCRAGAAVVRAALRRLSDPELGGRPGSPERHECMRVQEHRGTADHP
jgi:hypothetical protein